MYHIQSKNKIIMYNNTVTLKKKLLIICGNYIAILLILRLHAKYIYISEEGNSYVKIKIKKQKMKE